MFSLPIRWIVSQCLSFKLLFLIVISLCTSTNHLAIAAQLSSLLLPAQAQAQNQENHSSEKNDDDDEIPARIRIIHGVTQIHLTPEEQLQSGLVSETLEEIHYLPEQPVFGQVMAIQGLIELRSHYQNALLEQALTTSALKTAHQNYQRLKQLHKEAIISIHKLHIAQSNWLNQIIKLKTRDTALKNIRTTAEQSWGQPLTHSALDESSTLFQQLLNNQQILIRVSLKAGQSLPADTSFIFIAPDNDRPKAYKAYLISAAPQIDVVSQGETYFFHSHSARLRISMRIHAWIPQAGQSLSGITLPESAVV